MRPLIGDVRLHVSVLGEEWMDGVHRPVIVAVHGGPGVDAGTLRALMRPAAEYAQVLVPDQRGHGRSDYSEPGRWNLDTWADDLAELVTVLGVDQPVVLGTSFGGFVVQRYLARHPKQPAGAVLIGTSAREGDPVIVVERFRQAGGERAAEVMARAFRENTEDAEREWAEVCGPLLRRRAPSPAMTAALTHRIFTTEVNVHFMPALRRMDLRPGLAAARCPVLVLAGEQDPLIPPDMAEEIVSALPPGLAALHFLEAGHTILNDAAEDAHTLIREFAHRVTSPTQLR